MPLVDMPLEKLKTYQGISPKPADFEEYWARALAELDATDPQVTITPAKFQSPIADCYDMYFTGVGGARVYAKLLKPKNVQPGSPAVLHFHGYSGASHGWNYYLPYAASGMVVAALDCRGQGGLSEDNGQVKGNTHKGLIIRGLAESPEKLYFRSVFLDTAELARIVMAMDEVDETRVGCFGGSQGGALTIACASLEPRIRIAVPEYPFLCDYKRVWEMDLAVAAYEELKTYFRRFDPRHEEEEETFRRLGYIDLQYLAPRIRADVTMFTGLMDTICPPSTQFAAFNKMTCKKENKIYPDFGHEGLPEYEEMVYQIMLTL